MSVNLPDLKILRRKTAMLVSEIEQALGSYKLSGDDLSEEITVDQFSERGTSNQKTMYLDDFFVRVIRITKNTNQEEQVKKLYELAKTLDLWTIRGACSHPNNTFFPDYWYRAATIASNQIFSELGLDSVPETLALAESGSITDPPDDWVDKYVVTIPNNLPHQKEYDLTNLIGRDKEINSLHKNLIAQRTTTLAIVAPGGIGKTALALALLDRISRDHQAASWVDGIVYVTLKIDQLTTDGVIKIQSRFSSKLSLRDAMIEELKTAVTEGLSDIYGTDFHSLKEAVDWLGEEKIILCIDNLETLIIEHPQAVGEFLEAIPMYWKVIITSRISIDDAKHVPLTELKQKSAEQLARKYLEAKNGSNLDEAEITNIAERCLFNPLSIRLTLDLFILGDTLPEALNTAQDAIADFSFNNLVEKLSQNAIYILEYSTSNGTVSRTKICENLRISNEEAAEAISELNRTSLVKRVASKDGDFVEQWEVSGAISGLVRGNHRMYAARVYLTNQKNVNKNRTQIDEKNQDQKGAKPWDNHYVDPKLEETFKTFLFEVNRNIKSAMSKRGESYADRLPAINSVLQSLENNESVYSDKSEYWVQRGKLNRMLIQNDQMQRCYDIAVKLSPDDIYIQFKYAKDLKISKLRNDALKNYESLVHLCESSNNEYFEIDFINILYQDYFSVLLVMEEWQRMIDETVKWKETDHLRPITGSYRAIAYQRLSERATQEDKEKFINSAISISQDVLTKDGYFKITCTTALRIMEEIITILESVIGGVRFIDKSPELSAKAMSYCDKHLKEVVYVLPHDSNLSSKIKRLSKVDCNDNPFQSVKWLTQSNPIMEHGVSPDDIPEGTIIGVVKRLPLSKQTDGGNAPFLFAKGDDGTEYYVSKDLLHWKDWNKIAEGYKIGILEHEAEPSGKGPALTALKVMAINW